MPRSTTRAVTALLTAAVGAAGLVTAAVPAAAAADACTVGTSIPARVSIDRAVQQVPVTLRTTCTDLEVADVFLVGPGDELYDLAYWEVPVDGAVYAWEVYGDNVPGGYRTEDFYTEPEDADVTASYSKVVAKFGSKAGLTAARTGSRVTLTACASYYNGRRDAFVPWSAHKVTVQKLAADGRTWEYVRTLGTNARGCAVVDVTSAGAATFRATTYETYQIFSRTTPTVTA